MNKLRIKKSSLLLFTAIFMASLTGCSTLNKRENMVFTCIPTQLFRCEPGEPSCMTIPIIKTLGVVQINIDIPAAKVKSIAEGKVLTESGIDSVQIENHLIYLNGKGVGYDKTYRSWNAIINRKDGNLYSSSVTTGAGHVIYGECHENSQ
jgi:hypothetical protein